GQLIHKWKYLKSDEFSFDFSQSLIAGYRRKSIALWGSVGVVLGLRPVAPDFLVVCAKRDPLAKFSANQQDKRKMRTFCLAAWHESGTLENGGDVNKEATGRRCCGGERWY